MHGIPPELAAMFGGQLKQKTRKPKDSIAFPKHKTRELFELIQAAHDIKDGQPGKTRARFEMWKFIYDNLPIIKGKECQLNTQHSLTIMVEIMKDRAKPEVGGLTDEGHRIEGMYEIPREHHYRLFELSDTSDCGPLHRYNLWSFIGEIIPEVAENPMVSYTICIDQDWTGILRIAKGSDDEDE